MLHALGEALGTGGIATCVIVVALVVVLAAIPAVYLRKPEPYERILGLIAACRGRSDDSVGNAATLDGGRVRAKTGRSK